MSRFYSADKSEYQKNNPSWHEEDSPYKVKHILSLLKQLPADSNIRSIAEVGCGAGEILNLLHQESSRQDNRGPIRDNVILKGFDIASDAIAKCESKKKERLSYQCGDFLESGERFDMLMLIDVFEHVDDYYSFLRSIREKSRFFIFNIPLEMCALGIIRNLPTYAYKRVGHKHFFHKETALFTLEDCGYHINTYEYGLGEGLPAKRLRGKLAKFPKKVLFSVLNKDFAVRLLGGSLFVLASSEA